MRKFLISAVLVSTVAIAAPAAAQWQYPQYPQSHNTYGHNRGAVQGVQNQVRQIQQQIDRMYQRRLISNGERRNLHERAQNINRRLYDYSRNGLSQREYFDLQNRVQNLRQRLQNERFEGRNDRRDDRWNDRRDDRWEGRRDRRDDRRRDRRDRDDD